MRKAPSVMISIGRRLVALCLSQLVLAGGQAYALNCRAVFATVDSEARTAITELAKLHLTRTQHANHIVTKVSEKDFRASFDAIVERLGLPGVRKGLRAEVARLKALEYRLEERRQKESSIIGPIKLDPSLLKKIKAINVSPKFDFEHLPDRTNVIEIVPDGYFRLKLTDKAPYFELEPFHLPKANPRLPNQPKPATGTQWTIKKMGSKWIALGKEQSNAADFWIWDIEKGPEAVWRLPVPVKHGYYGIIELGLNTLSPNGRFAITVDEAGRITRLDLDSGEVKTSAPFGELTGMWVQDDGSLIAWNKAGTRIAISKNLRSYSVAPIEQLFGFQATFRQISTSSDQKQAILLTASNETVLLDFDKMKHRAFQLDQGDRKVSWRENVVWVGSPARPIPRNFSDMGDVVIRWQHVHEGSHARREAWILHSDNRRKKLVIDDLDNGTQRVFPFPKDLLGNNSDFDPAISEDGRLVALSGQAGKILIYDTFIQEIAGSFDVKEEGDIREITARPQFGPDGSTLMLSVFNKDHEFEVQIWRLTKDNGSAE